MILRKPYAFFIKHFRLIHMILAVLVCYSAYRTKLVMDFFNTYAASVVNVVGQDLTGTLLYGIIFLLPLFIILFTTIIMTVMIAKKKPFPFYIINIIIFIFSFVVLEVAKSTLLSMELSLLDIRTVRLVRDLVTVSFLAQAVSAFIFIFRATGFDLKKFGFQEDLQDLNIEEEDREEFEVAVNIDKNKLQRKIHRFFRFAKYTYKENKLAVIVASITVVLTLGIFIYIGTRSSETKIGYNQYFTGNHFTISLVESYVTNQDYRGKVIDEDYSYIILKIKVKNNTTSNAGLDLATTKIVIGNYSYTPVSINRDSFIEFGHIYEGEDISKEYTFKTLLYRIPKELINENKIFYFIDKTNLQKDGLFKRTYVNLKLTDLDNDPTTQSTDITQVLNFEDSVIGNYQLNISEFDIQKQYKLNYNFCVKQDCYPSYEYLKPSITSNYDKALLKITGTITKGDNDVRDVYDLYDFIEKFGTLSYVIDDKTYLQNVNFKEVVPKNVKTPNTYYLEVQEEVLQASHIDLFFKIKNKTYQYTLK